MEPSEDYIQNMIAMQTRLYAYLLTLLADSGAADDVLQETNLVLCRKAREFEEGTNFEAWAFQIARLQCMAYWRIRRRDRLVFDNDTLNTIASQIELRLSSIDDRTSALRNCLKELPLKQRSLIEKRYSDENIAVKDIADRMGKTEGSISQSLHRARSRLLRCIQFKMTQLGS